MRFRAAPAATAVALFAVLAPHAWAQTRAGGEFQVNTYTTGGQQRPQAAVAKNGSFVITWASPGQAPDGSSFGQFGQRYDSAGVPLGAEFMVNTYTTGYQASILPKGIAADDKGNFIVVWHDGTGAVNGQDGSLTGVFAQRYASSGAPAGGEFRVNTYTTGAQRSAEVAMNRDGRFVVVWNSNAQDGSGYGVFGQRYDSTGAPVGAEFQVNTYTTGQQSDGSVAYAGDGSFVVAWHSAGEDGSGFGIFGQRFSATGSPAGSEFQVNSVSGNNQYFPSVAVAEDGRFAVAFMTPDNGISFGIAARSFDATGNPVGDEFAVNTYTTGTQQFPSADADNLGNFTVVWYGAGADGAGNGVSGRRFTAAGVARDPAEFLVNTYTTGTQQFAAVTADSVGNLVVSWESNPHATDPSSFGASAQRYGGLQPTALNVNTTGNLVWEPGQVADVRPTWRNVNGAAQTFAGTLGSITGPAGANYMITDVIGNYGTVANNTSQPCTDCYAVSVDNPTIRPVQHWDASAVESITPDAQGQQKRWTLHIGGSFTDVAGTNVFNRFIETLLHYSITGGCGGTNYCPSSSTTREQMSVFVLVAKEGAGFAPPACTTPLFNDVPASNPFCRFIEELSRRGVVSGCGNGNYCPADAVTRDQMAVFVLRTLDTTFTPPACGTPVFADVPASSGFCRWIEELARRGVVSGCGGGNYCPSAAVTREQMGVFISLTFGLTLYGV